MITQSRLKELLHYDADSGLFYYRKSTGRKKAFSVAGSLRKKDGYVRICLDNVHYLAQRLAWLYVTGEWPEHDTDHIDMCRSNNRFSNLRAATRSQNMSNSGARRNNTTGYKGVFKNRSGFSARITVGYQDIYLGSFKSAKEASTAYLVAAKKYHQEFARI